MHKNKDRATTVAKKYESGLIWTEANTGGVNWLRLSPSVVVNRFPRDANASLKFCGDRSVSSFPRWYEAADVIDSDRFIVEYSLTACVSLLRAFVDDGATCSKKGQVCTVA